MLKDNAAGLNFLRLEDLPDLFCVLVDDRGVRDDVDETLHLFECSVVKRKSETCERFPATCGNCQCKSAFPSVRRMEAVVRNVPSKFIDL